MAINIITSHTLYTYSYCFTPIKFELLESVRQNLMLPADLALPWLPSIIDLPLYPHEINAFQIQLQRSHPIVPPT